MAIAAAAGLLSWPGASALASHRSPRAVALVAGHSPGVAVDAAGVAHVSFSQAVPGTATGQETVAYCPLAASGRLACAPRTALRDGGLTGPTYVNPISVDPTGRALAIASCRVNRTGDAGEVIATAVRSLDGGATFSAPIDLGHKTACSDGAYGPDGTVTLVGSLVNTTSLRASLAGPPATQIAQLLPGTVQDPAVDYYGQRPVVVAQTTHGSLLSSIWSGVGDANAGATWSPRSRRIGRYDHVDLDSGARGLLLIGQTQFGTRVVVHHFNGQRFGRGTVVHRRRRLALGGHVAIAQDGRGRVLALWQERSARVLFASASRDGRRWSSPITIARSASSHPGKLEVAVDPAGRGVAVWTDNDKRLLAVRLNIGHVLHGRP